MKLSKVLILVLGFVFCCSLASANVKQKKAYQAAFPGSKPKCIECHTNKLPKKKDESTHELNVYGLAAQAAAETPTEDTYKSIGPAEDFVEEEAVEEVTEAVEEVMEEVEEEVKDSE